ncbi:MAG: hypothetical protein P8181_04285 [bacterium]
MKARDVLHGGNPGAERERDGASILEIMAPYDLTSASGSTPALVPGNEFWDNRFSTPGTDDWVFALAADGGVVYVGGDFTQAGGRTVNRIARWDGGSWGGMGGGVNGNVNAIAVGTDGVYVGGNFTSTGGGSANYIAKWNGSSWSALGLGLDGIVNTIAASGNDIYVGGSFTTAGGISANGIAKWDGNGWSALGRLLPPW